MKIALVHDHLISAGGGERVLKAFTELWPDAPIYTLIFDPSRTYAFFRQKDIRTSFLQRLPFKTSRYQWYLPLRPRAVESLDLTGYDVVLSNSAALAKGVITGPQTLHINYCHTPTRFLWINDQESLDPLERLWPVRRVSQYYKRLLKRWDIEAVKRVDRFIANSENVQSRIRYFYKKDSEVIYPPVDTYNYKISYEPRDYYLSGGRMASYKRFDMVIQAFNKLDMPLKIFGQGPWLNRLKKLAGRQVEFVGSASESAKAELFARARAFIHPQVEDFGITAVESMASGRPVIAYRAGGALETVRPGITGVFFDDQDWQSLANAVIRVDTDRFDPGLIKSHAEKFSEKKFKEKISSLVENYYLRHLNKDI